MIIAEFADQFAFDVHQSKFVANVIYLRNWLQRDIPDDRPYWEQQFGRNGVFSVLRFGEIRMQLHPSVAGRQLYVPARILPAGTSAQRNFRPCQPQIWSIVIYCR